VKAQMAASLIEVLILLEEGNRSAAGAITGETLGTPCQAEGSAGRPGFAGSGSAGAGVSARLQPCAV